MHRNHSSQLNQSVLIHNMHLIRKTQQVMDYMITVVSSLDNINSMVKQGNMDIKELAANLDRVIAEMDSVVLAVRGRVAPPSKDDLIMYSGANSTPPRIHSEPTKSNSMADIEKEIKEVLNNIFDKVTSSDKTGDEIPKTPKAKPKTKKPKKSDNSSECPFDAEDLEDFLNGL